MFAKVGLDKYRQALMGGSSVVYSGYCWGKMLYDQWDIYSVSLCMAGICMGKNAL